MDYDNNNLEIEQTKAVVTNKAPRKSNTIAITSLVFGIVSLLLFWSFIYPVITGLIGIIIGIISLAKKCDNSKLAIAGIITSAIGFIIGVVVMLIYIVAIVNL